MCSTGHYILAFVKLAGKFKLKMDENMYGSKSLQITN